MSNFSQYFPASSGGGSGGTPINGYTPFLVTGTGNPSGYDATTGLYTHPDGTFWLKTGNTLSSNTITTTYPNTTVSTPGSWSVTTNFQLQPGTYTRDRKMWLYNSATSQYFQANRGAGNTAAVYQVFNSTGAFVSRINMPFDNSAFYGYVAVLPDATEVFMNITPYNNGGYGGTTWQDTAGNTYPLPSGITWNNIGFTAATQTDLYGLGGVSLYVTNIATSTASTITLSKALSTLQWDGTDNTMYGFDNTNNFYCSVDLTTGVVTNVVDLTVGTIASGAAVVAHKAGDLTTFYITDTTVLAQTTVTYDGYTKSNDAIGDSTARTNTDSAQPLFTRIK